MLVRAEPRPMKTGVTIGAVALVIALGGSAHAPLASESPLESARLAEVARAVAQGDHRAIDQFWTDAQRQGTPIVEPIAGDPTHVLATFVWKGSSETKDVVLMAEVDGIAPLRDKRGHLVRLPETNIWYRSHRLPASAEFSYLFTENPAGDDMRSVRTALHEDPLNPRQYRILTGPVRSIATMPAVPKNPWIEETMAAKGAIRTAAIASPRLQNPTSRELTVYTTPGDIRNANLLVFLDAEAYTKSVPTPRILDNLYAAKKLGPTIAVFVPDGDGTSWKDDTYFNDSYVAFLAEELVPWAQRTYGFAGDPRRTAIVGDSIHGLAAAYASFRYPRVFGRVISQSGSFWLNNRDADEGEPEWLTRQLLRAPAHDAPMFCLDVGQMEVVANDADRMFPPFVPGSTSLLAANRHLRDVLEAKGYAVHYIEVYGGHEPLRWKRTLPEAIIAVLPEQAGVQP